MAGKLYVVGVGPGHHDHMTFRAKQVIEESDTIVGYSTYVNLVEDLIDGKDVYKYDMTQEVERAQQCIKSAKDGKKKANPCQILMSAAIIKPYHRS